MTRLILAAAIVLAYVVVVRIVRAGTPEPEDDIDWLAQYRVGFDGANGKDFTAIRIRLPEQATVTWRH